MYSFVYVYLPKYQFLSKTHFFIILILISKINETTNLLGATIINNHQDLKYQRVKSK